MRTLLLTLFLAYALAGCATTAEQANERAALNKQEVELLNAAPCCTALSSLRYVDIRSGRSDVFPINASTPIILAENGRSHALGFRVPPRQATTYLTVRAFGAGSIMAHSMAPFLPAFLFLNDDGTPIESRVPLTIRPVKADWVDRPSLEATIELPPSSVATRIVVYTRPENVNRRSPVIVDIGVFLVPNGIYGSVRAILP